MSKYTGHLCDRCGKRAPEHHPIEIATGYHNRVIAEDDNHVEYDHADLCNTCAGEAVQWLIDELLGKRRIRPGPDHAKGLDLRKRLLPRWTSPDMVKEPK